MKTIRKRLLCTIAAVFLIFTASCGKSGQNIVNTSTKTSNTAKSGACIIEETDRGFYLVSVNDDEYLYFYDEAAKTAVKTCGKANCQHNSDSCNAKFGSSGSINWYNLQFYQGKIYLWTSSSMNGVQLYSADPDGTNHQDLGALKIDMTRGQGGIEASIISDDMVYVLAIVGTNHLGYQYMRFYERSLEPDAEAHLIFADEDEKTTEHRMGQLVAEDGLIYFTDIAFYDGLNRMESRLYRYDPSMDELKTVLALENRRIAYTVKNQKVYYSAYDYAANAYEKVRCYDPAAGKSTDFFQTGGQITWDGKHFIILEFEYDAVLSEKYQTAVDKPSAVVFVSEDGKEEKTVTADQLAEDPSEMNICMSENYIYTEAYMFDPIENKHTHEIRIFRKADVLNGSYDAASIHFIRSMGPG